MYIIAVLLSQAAETARAKADIVYDLMVVLPRVFTSSHTEQRS